MHIISGPRFVGNVARICGGIGPGITRSPKFGGVFHGTPAMMFVTGSASCSVSRVSYKLLKRGVVLST